MKNFNFKKWWLPITCAVLFVFIGIYGGYVVGSDNMQNKLQVGEDGFVGTYRIGEPKNIYLAILSDKVDEDITFYVYTETAESLEVGTYQIIDNTIVLKNKEDKLIYTIIYSNNEFWIVDLQLNKTYKINKVSDQPIV